LELGPAGATRCSLAIGSTKLASWTLVGIMSTMISSPPPLKSSLPGRGVLTLRKPGTRYTDPDAGQVFVIFAVTAMSSSQFDADKSA